MFFYTFFFNKASKKKKNISLSEKFYNVNNFFINKPLIFKKHAHIYRSINIFGLHTSNMCISNFYKNLNDQLFKTIINRMFYKTKLINTYISKKHIGFLVFTLIKRNFIFFKSFLRFIL